jgi:hypothetical protein
MSLTLSEAIAQHTRECACCFERKPFCEFEDGEIIRSVCRSCIQRHLLLMREADDSPPEEPPRADMERVHRWLARWQQSRNGVG